MIRLLLVILFLVTFFLLSIPVYLIEWILGKFNMNARHKSSFFIVQHAFKIILFISGATVDIKGFENIPADKAVLYVGNHSSFYDIIVAYSILPTLTGFVAKKEMIKVPFLNVWMYYMNCLFIDRNNIREGLKTILKGVDQIKSGISVFIFPEGTRSKTGEMAPFKEGSMKMASKTGCPIIPVAFKNTSSLFEAQFPRIKGAHVSIEFGEPIYPKELTKEELKFLGAYSQNRIQNMLNN